jgi:hypothetical protein
MALFTEVELQAHFMAVDIAAYSRVDNATLPTSSKKVLRNVHDSQMVAEGDNG